MPEQKEAEGSRLRGPRAAARAVPTTRGQSFHPTRDPVPGEGSRVWTGGVPGLKAAASEGTADIPSCGVCTQRRTVKAGVLAVTGTFCPSTGAVCVEGPALARFL